MMIYYNTFDKIYLVLKTHYDKKTFRVTLDWDTYNI